MNTISKAKQKRQKKGRNWVSQYDGSRIIAAYKNKFKVPLITAVNDLEAIGVSLDEREVALIKLSRHHYNEQHLLKEELDKLTQLVSD